MVTAGQRADSLSTQFQPLDVRLSAVPEPLEHALRFSGEVMNPTGAPLSEAQLTITLFDQHGQVIGYRSLILDPAVTQPQPFQLAIVPFAGTMARFTAVADGWRAQPTSP